MHEIKTLLVLLLLTLKVTHRVGFSGESHSQDRELVHD